MNFPFFIAKRYLVSKKSTNVINIISIISVIGVTFGTMAFILVLSVFNGLEDLVSSMFNSFDPDLRIESAEGGSFNVDTILIKKVRELPEIAYSSEVIEKNVLLEYDKKQVIATMKAVDDKFVNVSGLDTMIYDGHYLLHDNSVNYAIAGYGISARLGISPDYAVRVWAPIQSEGYTMNIASAFNSRAITVAGIFSIQQELDDKYFIVPIEFARDLMNFGKKATAIELKLIPGESSKKIEKKIQHILGDGFEVKNRYEQKPLIYKILKTERLAIIAILSFILLVSSFNIIGSMIMMILDKRSDIGNINAIGANVDELRRIFFYQGWMISLIGDIIGIIIGLALALGQQYFGWLKFPTSGAFMTNAYPVKVVPIDVLLVFVVVVIIGYIVAKYPVRFITKKFIAQNRV